MKFRVRSRTQYEIRSPATLLFNIRVRNCRDKNFHRTSTYSSRADRIVEKLRVLRGNADGSLPVDADHGDAIVAAEEIISHDTGLIAWKENPAADSLQPS